jgi:hypothetical protein
MINFIEAAVALETYLKKLQDIGAELRVIRESHIHLNLSVLTKEEEGRQKAKEIGLNATATRDFVKSFAFSEELAEMEAKERMKIKEEEKELLIEGLNIIKSQIRLVELDYRIHLTPNNNGQIQGK